jgi:hypothetical protein
MTSSRRHSLLRCGEGSDGERIHDKSRDSKQEALSTLEPEAGEVVL